MPAPSLAVSTAMPVPVDDGRLVQCVREHEPRALAGLECRASDCDSCGRGSRTANASGHGVSGVAPAAVARAISDSAGARRPSQSVLARHEQPRAFGRPAPVGRCCRDMVGQRARGERSSSPARRPAAAGRGGGESGSACGTGVGDERTVPTLAVPASAVESVLDADPDAEPGHRATGTARDRRGSRRTCCPGRGK